MKSLRNKKINRTAHKKHELKPNNLQDFCRTCLEELKSTSTSTSSSAVNYVIRETPELKELLNSYTTLNISEESEDVYPQRMCSKCYHTAQLFQHFRDNALQSGEVLRAIVENVEAQDEAVKETNVEPTFTEGRADNNCFEAASSEVSADSLLMSAAENSNAEETDYSDTFTQSIEMKVKTKDTVLTFADNSENVTANTNDDEIDVNVCAFTSKEAAAKLKRKADDSRPANVECDDEEPMCDRNILNQSNEIKVETEIRTEDFVLNFSNDSVDIDADNANDGEIEVDVGASTSQEAATELKRRAHGSRPAKFQCTVEGCGSAFTTKKSMQHHIQRHNAGDIFALEDDILQEIQWLCHKTNKSDTSEVGNVNPSKNFQCPLCQRNSKNRYALYHHIRLVHEGERDFKCSLCPKAFRQNSVKILHEKMHTTKPFFCNICYVRFKHKSGLEHHMSKQKHKNNEDYQAQECSICKKLYKSATSLQTHLRVIHNKKGTNKENSR